MLPFAGVADPQRSFCRSDHSMLSGFSSRYLAASWVARSSKSTASDARFRSMRPAIFRAHWRASASEKWSGTITLMRPSLRTAWTVFALLALRTMSTGVPAMAASYEPAVTRTAAGLDVHRAVLECRRTDGARLEVWEIAILAVGGLFAGAINAIAGGASLLTVPLLVLAGVPGNAANGSNRLGVITSSATAAIEFRRRGVHDFRKVWSVLPAVVAGSLVGSFGVSRLLDSDQFEKAFGFLMVPILILSLRKPKPRADGTTWPRWLTLLVFFGIGLSGGARSIVRVRPRPEVAGSRRKAASATPPSLERSPGRPDDEARFVRRDARERTAEDTAS